MFGWCSIEHEAAACIPAFAYLLDEFLVAPALARANKARSDSFISVVIRDTTDVSVALGLSVVIVVTLDGATADTIPQATRAR